MKLHITTQSWSIFFLALTGIAGLALGIYWIFWRLWCWALPQLWGNGPENIIRPSYWLFVACLFLLSIIGNTIYGGSKT